MSDKKWVIHIIGPDEVIEHPDEITALREANALNKAISKLERTDNTPFVMALVKDENSEDL
jgi:hypothetical protein